MINRSAQTAAQMPTPTQMTTWTKPSALFPQFVQQVWKRTLKACSVMSILVVWKRAAVGLAPIGSVCTEVMLMMAAESILVLRRGCETRQSSLTRKQWVQAPVRAVAMPRSSSTAQSLLILRRRRSAEEYQPCLPETRRQSCLQGHCCISSGRSNQLQTSLTENHQGCSLALQVDALCTSRFDGAATIGKRCAATYPWIFTHQSQPPDYSCGPERRLKRAPARVVSWSSGLPRQRSELVHSPSGGDALA
jgi:hypothetical protein